MTTQLDPEVLKAVVEEGRKRGFSDNAIAERLGLPLNEVMRCSSSRLTRGMYNHEFVTDTADTAKVLRAIERGNASIQASKGTSLLRKMNRDETLALLVDLLGFDGARQVIAAFIHRTGCADDAADSIGVPRIAAWAVLTGAFPAPESLQ